MILILKTDMRCLVVGIRPAGDFIVVRTSQSVCTNLGGVAYCTRGRVVPALVYVRPSLARCRYTLYETGKGSMSDVLFMGRHITKGNGG